ncbi:hypothetical protein PHAVU_002G168500 [Phaseolus vulgaris]|uniref:C2H2-type domain-containing protein n=1 Tax=Phaseolus vulgaris TaxID=3885 RepID=V7CKF3_PHAVU|nr:hypothetical protein PHAVU_002G168500g [Phaseolus vulgaris]XP_007158626.1 hypothetical protein PHAVU_002G168500g [Phaseolus vulgaris]ESW30619.1 hypothetical protein PHAVU_002G168500g [Phaseolus vulgaris]ESW30620.1 hypothetical protein PHAVU_002G168500g [Phaseolus vulgaris]
MEERKYVCKYCSKRFPCGKSLGGHIRTHMTEERSNADADMFIKSDGVKKKRDLWCEDVVGNPIYGLRENPKKTMRFVHSGGGAAAAGANYEKEERFCKECGKGFPSLKALCGHMACHSDKEKRTIKFEDSDKKLKLVMDSQSDTETCAPSHPRRSKRTRVKTINLSNHPFSSSSPSSSSVVPLANGSSPVSEVEQEQEEVARCLMLLSRDSSFKGRFASVTEFSDNNSVILEAKSSSPDTRLGVSNGSRYFKHGPKAKMVDSDVSNDEFKWPKVGDKSSKYTATLVKKLAMEDLDYDRTDGTARKFDSRKRSNYDSLYHNPVGGSSKIANGFGNEVCGNGTKGWKYELEGERDYDSYDSIEESHENSSETESYPAPRSHNSKALNGKKSTSKAKKKLKSKKSRDHECPICYKIFRSGQALGGHKRSHFIGGSEENTLVIKQAAPVVPCLIDLNLPAPVDE